MFIQITRDTGLLDIRPHAGLGIYHALADYNLVDEFQLGADVGVGADYGAFQSRAFADERSVADYHIAFQEDVAGTPCIVLNNHRRLYFGSMLENDIAPEIDAGLGGIARKSELAALVHHSQIHPKPRFHIAYLQAVRTHSHPTSALAAIDPRRSRL